MASAAPTEAPVPTRTLVVDDSPLIRRTVEMRLSKLGHRVETAVSGEDAFSLCMEKTFDLVISDVTMGAVSGVHLCRMLRAEPATATLPIVLLTAEDDPRSRFWGRNAGADAYLAKDEMHRGLQAVVDSLLSKVDRVASRPIPGRPVDPLARMSSVLDHHLFSAVVTSEAQRLMHYIHDPSALMDHALTLLNDVLGCAYAALEVFIEPSSLVAVLARGGWPEQLGADVLATFRIDARPEQVQSRRVPDSRYGAEMIRGEHATYPIVVAHERVGNLHLYGGRRPLSAIDRETADVLTASMAPVLKSMLLLETTRRMATTDALTGLANRRFVAERLRDESERSARYGVPFALLLCDIDHFKRVNDGYGHNVGDDVLKAVAGRIQRSIRNIDIAGRWGGEEFIILLPNTDESGARIPAERVRAAIEALPPFEPGPPRVTTSVGVAAWRKGVAPEALVDLADKALYEAKQSGRNRVALAR